MAASCADTACPQHGKATPSGPGDPLGTVARRMKTPGATEKVSVLRCRRAANVTNWTGRALKWLGTHAKRTMGIDHGLPTCHS
jgi:hypothetical protein